MASMGDMSYSGICQNLRGEIASRMRTCLSDECSQGDVGRVAFLPADVAPTILHHEALSEWFDAFVAAAGSHVGQALGMSGAVFADRIQGQSLQPFFAVLVWVQAGPVATQAAIEWLVSSSSPSKERPGVLPMSLEKLKSLFAPDEPSAYQFWKEQPAFCTLVLREGSSIQSYSPDAQRLPYETKEKIGHGAFGNVYRVKVVKGHFTRELIACKEFSSGEQDTQDFQRERSNNEVIRQSTFSCSNILTILASLQADGGCSSLLMPLAMCDLHTYMFLRYPEAPSSLQEKVTFLKAAEGMVSGLAYLHGGIYHPTRGPLCCIHMDIRPRNIFVFDGGGGHLVWKIGDFGMSRLEPRGGSSLGHSREARKNSLSRHVDTAKRTSTTMYRTSTTIYRPSKTFRRPSQVPGQLTYQAPESVVEHSSGQEISVKGDIWSLGCVLSVLFTYLSGGAEALDEYSKERLFHTDELGSNVFYAPSLYKGWAVNPAVHDQHSRTCKRDKRSKRGLPVVDVAPTLKYIEKSLLVEVGRRPEAGEIQAKVGQVAQAYEEAHQKSMLGGSDQPRSKSGFFPNLFSRSGLISFGD